jgi:hypothetical protein
MMYVLDDEKILKILYSQQQNFSEHWSLCTDAFSVFYLNVCFSPFLLRFSRRFQPEIGVTSRLNDDTPPPSRRPQRKPGGNMIRRTSRSAEVVEVRVVREATKVHLISELRWVREATKLRVIGERKWARETTQLRVINGVRWVGGGGVGAGRPHRSE